MIQRFLFCSIFSALMACAADGQVLSFPTFGPNYTNALAGDAVETARMDFDVFTINGQNSGSTPFQTPSGSVSMLDLKAPGKAMKEYTKGYQLLLKKDY